MTTDEDAPLRGFVAAAAAHDVNANGRFALHAVVHALEPMIEPALLERIEVDGRIRRELRLSGVAYARTAVSPGTDDEPLRALLVLAQSGEVQVRHLQGPGVVPTRHVVDGDVLVVGEGTADLDPHLLPHRILAAMAHGLDQPLLVVGGELQRRGA